VEGLTYCYRIKARNTVGDSDYSNEDCTTLTPAPLSTPTGFSVVTGAPGELELAWEDNSDQEDGYEIERAAPGAAFEQIAEVPPDAESFVDSALSSGATFCYRVRAFRVLTVGAGREYSGYAGPACEMVP